MKLKKTIAGMLAAVTLMSSMAVSYAAGTKFSDVSEDAWYASAVNVASSHGMVSGIGNNKFAPNMTMNRAMLVQILYNHAGKPSVSGDAAFTDVQSGSWYYDAVQWAAKNNVVAGIGNNKFDPDGAITREQFATILCNYYEKTTGESPAVDFTLLNNFGDSSDVSEWASIGIGWAVTNGIINGTDAGKLLPKQTATRAEAAQMLSNYLDLSGDTHKYELTNTVDPTETAEGKKEYTCSICNKVKTEAIPATGKKPDENCNHAYTEAVTKEATCTEDGVKTFTCSKCEGTYTEKIPAIGHDYESEVTLEPTETAPGIRKYFCNNCGHRYEEEIPPTGTATTPIDKNNLTEEQIYGKIIALKSEYPEGTTWTNDNYYAWKGGIFSGGYGCAGFAFLLSDSAFDELPAQVVTKFSYDQIRVGDILYLAGGQHYAIVLQIDDNNITLAEGNWNNSIHWGRNITRSEAMQSAYILTRYPDFTATKHNYSFVVTKPATCTEYGTTTYTCSDCGDTFTASIPATGHDYKITTSGNIETYTCIYCGISFTHPVNQHNWVTQSGIDGVTEYKCTQCGTVVDYKNFLGGNFDFTCKGSK